MITPQTIKEAVGSQGELLFSSITDEQIQTIINEQQIIVQSYIDKELNWENPLAFFKKLTVDIIVFELYKKEARRSVPEIIINQMKVAFKNLQYVQQGKISIFAEKKQNLEPQISSSSKPLFFTRTL